MSEYNQLKIFSYLTAEKASLYRQIMHVFTLSKERFSLHLRPREILEELKENFNLSHLDEEGVTDALKQLCAWGNLQAHQDNSEFKSLAEYLKQHFLYQITEAGEAAEQAVGMFKEFLNQPGELKITALSDIETYLEELLLLTLEKEWDAAKINQAFVPLWDRFADLTNRAQKFISGLQRRIDLQAFERENFIAYKNMLIDYLENFIRELVISTGKISRLIQNLEENKVHDLLEIAVGRELSDQFQLTPEKRADEEQRWFRRWEGLRNWFINHDKGLSQAEELRRYALSAIPELVRAVNIFNEKRTSRSDRTSDLSNLACWFAETDSDKDAHRLFRVAFGLSPSRHLRSDPNKNDQEDPFGIRTPWLEAPAVEIPIKFRKTGRNRTTRSHALIDRTKEKKQLAAMEKEERLQLEKVRQRLADGKRLKLSEMAELDPAEFYLFLEFLGDALSLKTAPDHVVETQSADGTINIRLEPIPGETIAVIRTKKGDLSGPDHFITLEDLFPEPTLPTEEKASLPTPSASLDEPDLDTEYRESPRLEESVVHE